MNVEKTPPVANLPILLGKGDRLVAFVLAVIGVPVAVVALAMAVDHSTQHEPIQSGVIIPNKPGVPSELTVYCFGYHVYSRTSLDASSLKFESSVWVLVPTLVAYLFAACAGATLGWKMGLLITRTKHGKATNENVIQEINDYREIVENAQPLSSKIPGP